MEEGPRQRRCDRPGCAAAATAWLSFDGGTGQVRIQRLTANPPPLTLVLCTTHTDRLVVPRGWVLHDERDEGHLFAVPGEAAPGDPPAPAVDATPTPVTPGAKPRAAGRRRAPRKAAASAAADADADRTPGDAAPAAAAPAAPALGDPELFAADPPPAGALAPVAPPEEHLTDAPAERRLLHRAFRAASTREAPEPDPHAHDPHAHDPHDP